MGEPVAPMFARPLASFDVIPMEEANRLLIEWGHKMGPCNRPMGLLEAHGLFLDGTLHGLTVTADLIAENVAGYGRPQAIELARVCASRPGLCRILVRLWREAVLPMVEAHRRRPLVGLSYQDAVMHSGNLYRFDGWKQVGTSRSGTDQRSGRKGRSKVIWAWAA